MYQALRCTGIPYPLAPVGGDLFEYINFQQRYDIDARIRRAQNLSPEFLKPLPPGATPPLRPNLRISFSPTRENEGGLSCSARSYWDISVTKICESFADGFARIGRTRCWANFTNFANRDRDGSAFTEI
jgi:hypothetical protein